MELAAMELAAMELAAMELGRATDRPDRRHRVTEASPVGAAHN
jgi:hypothetical protein